MHSCRFVAFVSQALFSKPAVQLLICAGSLAFSVACGGALEDELNSQTEGPESTEMALGTVRVEAENMTRVGYEVANVGAASAGKLARVMASTTNGTLTNSFSGDTADYDVYFGYFDESDGKSQYALRVAGVLVASWTGNENKPEANSTAFSRTRRLVLSKKRIFKGQAIQLTGTKNAGESAPVDYIEFIPVSAGSGLATRPSSGNCVVPARPSAGDNPLEFRAFGSNLTFNFPMRLDQPQNDPAGNRLYVAERDGAVVSFPKSPTATNAQKKQEFSLASLPNALPVQAEGEGGLLGMAFHPQFGTNGHLFLSYTTTNSGVGPNMRSVIARVTKNFATGNWGGYQIILGPFVQPAQNHNGGDLHFGPNDGFLYASFGDGGGGGDTFDNGQRHATFFSKILRIDIDGTSTGKMYRIPASNPWPNGEGGFQPEAYAYGFRNPFRFGIDRQNGQVWVGDVGQSAWEEIDVVTKGGNYGWNFREGKHCFEPATGCPTAGLIDPIFDYPRSGGATVTGTTVTGGTVIRNDALGPAAQGTYIFGDYGSAKVWALKQGPVRVTPVPVVGGGQKWVSFDLDKEGDMYGVALVPGKIFRLQQNTSANAGPTDYPATLTATGCFKANPNIPEPSLIPYELNSPLWSDGADKERFVSIPNGKKIMVEVDGDLDLPTGTVAVKTFLLGGKRIETRFLVRHSDGGWEGFTYEWNPAGTQANLLKTSKSKNVGNQTWYFPSRSDCAVCHTAAAGGSLGLEIKQLNRNFRYPSSGINANQIETWKHLGLFSNPPGAASSLGAYPDPFGNAPLASRARSYLHSNCSNCHRPGGGGATFDARFSVPFGAGAGTTNMCNVVPADTLGIFNARIVAPDSPLRSVIYRRASVLGADRMPPLASNLVHVAGTDLLSEWISSFSTCP